MRTKNFVMAVAALIAALFTSCESKRQKAETPSDKHPKSVLILSSSPRKGGNSDLLCDEFMKGALEAGHEVEKIRLSEYEINFLQTNNDYDDRSLVTPADDAPMIVDKMIRADVIVMATPIYYYNMNGQMLTMIDRIFERESELTDKEFYFIMTAGDPDKAAMDCALLGFRNFLRSTPTSREMGVIYGNDVSSKGDVIGKPVMKEAYEMGKNI